MATLMDGGGKAKAGGQPQVLRLRLARVRQPALRMTIVYFLWIGEGMSKRRALSR
jgi:hypothetical protein